jgi:hypothetical protein
VGPFIIEAVWYRENERGVKLPVRTMFGPFSGFDSAHEWMQGLGAGLFPTQLIHPLQSPLDEDQAGKLAAAIRKARQEP